MTTSVWFPGDKVPAWQRDLLTFPFALPDRSTQPGRQTCGLPLFPHILRKFPPKSKEGESQLLSGYGALVLHSKNPAWNEEGDTLPEGTPTSPRSQLPHPDDRQGGKGQVFLT